MKIMDLRNLQAQLEIHLSLTKRNKISKTSMKMNIPSKRIQSKYTLKRKNSRQEIINKQKIIIKQKDKKIKVNFNINLKIIFNRLIREKST